MFKTYIIRNVSIGHRCSHFSPMSQNFRTDRQTDGKEQIPLKWGHKNLKIHKKICKTSHLPPLCEQKLGLLGENSISMCNIVLKNKIYSTGFSTISFSSADQIPNPTGLLRGSAIFWQFKKNL